MKNTVKKGQMLNVLSLEDSDLDFEIICEQLIHAGYQLQIARVEKEQEFTTLVKMNSYDLILADYNLPQFNAFEALKICQKFCPETPFLCVSGTIGEVLAIELLKNGATDYVLKDQLDRLPFAVKRAMKEAKADRVKRQFEQSLILSEEKYRNIFENVQDVFYQTNLKGDILEISPSVKNFATITREELIGKSVYEFYAYPEERKTLLEEIEKNGKITDYEIRFKSMNGEIKQTSVNAKLIYNSEGKPTHIDGTIRDITEKKLAEEAIKNSEAKLNNAQEIAHMGSWDYYLESGKINWSKNMFRMHGYLPFEIEPSYTDFLQRVHPEDKYMIELNLQKIKTTRNGVSYDSRFILPDGEIIWVQNNIVPVFDDEKLIELHGVNIDITEKKRTEQELIKSKENAEASDRLKTAFMNNVSHEIRTPLNGILGFVQILINPDFSSEEKSIYYPMLNHSCERLLNTVNNFMDISLLTSGNQKIRRKEIVLEELIDQAIEQFEEACQAKNLMVLVNKPQPTSDYIAFTDGELLSKVLHQLLDNAVKFTSHGYITVGFEKKSNDFILFVKDTGIGISEENKQSIFGEFLQADNADTRQFQGTGIGLSIAKGFIELLGGKIWLDSIKGKGSTFSVSVPINHQTQEYFQDQFQQNY